MKAKIGALSAALITKMGARDKNFKSGFIGAVKNKWQDSKDRYNRRKAWTKSK